ncbi:MAG: hypothetical protein IV100_09985 [Myxococcales bacterium]|nr:hypothetical protein [Myxococcales bacterium]
MSLFISVQALAARRKYALGIGAQGLSYGPDSPAGPPATSGSERWAPDDIDALRVTFLSGTVAEVAFRTRDGVTRCWVARVPDTLDFLNDISAFANAATLGERWRPRAWPLFILSLIGFPISPALMGLVFAPLITAVPEAWNELAVTLLLFSLLCRAATAPAMRTALTIRAFSRAPSGTDASRASVITTGRDDASRG